MKCRPIQFNERIFSLRIPRCIDPATYRCRARDNTTPKLLSEAPIRALMRKDQLELRTPKPWMLSYYGQVQLEKTSNCMPCCNSSIAPAFQRTPGLRSQATSRTRCWNGNLRIRSIVREALWGVSLRLIKPVIDEFGCQIVYIDYSRAMIENLETKLDSKTDNAVVSR